MQGFICSPLRCLGIQSELREHHRTKLGIEGMNLLFSESLSLIYLATPSSADALNTSTVGDTRAGRTTSTKSKRPFRNGNRLHRDLCCGAAFRFPAQFAAFMALVFSLKCIPRVTIRRGNNTEQGVPQSFKVTDIIWIPHPICGLNCALRFGLTSPLIERIFTTGA